jgi:RNA polymerase sigma factor (sigma-70 family)
MASQDDYVQQDAFAATWLRLAENLDGIREPLKLPGWLTTTAINEARNVARAARPQDISLDGWWQRGDTPEQGSRDGRAGAAIATAEASPEDVLLRDEVGDMVRQAFRKLSDECRELLTLLVMSDPAPTYAEVETLLGRPHGSLGPTRRRCLDKLRKLLDDGAPPRQPGWTSEERP